MKVTTLDGLNDAGTEYDELYTFGGRSFSIRRANNMKLVYDSGDQLESKIAQLLPKNLFNANADAEDTISDTFDSRSDDKVRDMWKVLFDWFAFTLFRGTHFKYCNIQQKIKFL